MLSILTGKAHTEADPVLSPEGCCEAFHALGSWWPQTLEVGAVEVTTSNIGDVPMLPDLLD